jgi:pimeloyl-ACP methyl ester carboxylesterase
MFVLRRQPLVGNGRPPLVFIHGCCGNGSTYWELTPDGRPGWATTALNAGWTTYLVDLPGHGRSPQPPDFGPMGLDPAVAAVRELLGEIGPAVLIGHSMGGTTLTRTLAAMTETERAGVLAAVLVDPARVAELDGAGPPRPGLETQLLPVHEDTMPRSRWYTDDILARQLAWRGPESGRAMAEMVGTEFGRTDNPAAFAGVPTIVLAADSEIGLGQTIMDSYRDHFGVELVMVTQDWGLPGHGHSMTVELGNEAIAERMLAWFDEVLPA